MNASDHSKGKRVSRLTSVASNAAIMSFRSLMTGIKLGLRTPRRRYGVLYVGLLVAFAVIYGALPGESFYHSNVSREPMLKVDKARIGDELREAIVETFATVNSGDTHNLDGLAIDAKTFRVISLGGEQEGDGVRMRFKLSLKLSHPLEDRKLALDARVTFLAGEEAGQQNEPKKRVKVCLPEMSGRWEKWKAERLAEVLFPWGPGEGGAGSCDDGRESVERLMPVSVKLDNDIRDFAHGIQGDPSRLKGHWLRMFYLSAVTITTVGYGDIAPLTGSARFLIALEAVLGIITIGLFINARSGREVRGTPAS